MNLMHRFPASLLAALLFLCPSVLRAQPSAGALSAGAFGEIGLSHTFTTQEGSKSNFAEFGDESSSPILAYRIGAAATYFISPSTAAMLGIGLDSRGAAYTTHVTLNIGPASQSYDAEVTNRVSYLGITPGFTIRPLYVGLNIGVPLGGSISSADSTVTLDDDAVESLALMLEPRIGVMVPVMESESGWLGLSAVLGYPLNRVSKDTEVNGETLQDPHRYASLHLGLTWQFLLAGR